jgi:putative selenate reductase FAD-binding subunit
MIDEYIRPTSVHQALLTMQKEGEKSAFIAGGTEIMRLDSSIDCTKVISLKDLGLDSITEKNKELRLGSTVTFQKALEHEAVPHYLKKALNFCGSRTRRNMATIGGNIALSRDDSYLMATLIAAKARLILADVSDDGIYNEENIPIREYHSFKEHFNESLILAVILNKPQRFVSSVRFSRTQQSPAAVTLAFGADISSDSIVDVRIAAAIKESGIVRLIEVEAGVSDGQFITAEDAAIQAATDIVFKDDITGSAAYKKYILGTAVADLYGQALKAVDNKGGVV